MSSAPRVVVAEFLAAEGIRVLTDGGADIVDVIGRDRDGLKDALRAGEALVVRSKVRVDEDLLETAPALRAIGRAGVGVDGIDVGAASRRGIVVINTPDASTIAAAEHTFALLLALCRNIVAGQRRILEGEWSARGLTGIELSGKTLGIVGLGRIGSAVAVRAKAFGMLVLAHDAFASEARAESLGAKLVALDDLLRDADIVTLHAPLTPQTQNLIGRPQLDRMKKGARLVNCARGGLVDENALLEALDDGRIAGAALDVVGDETLPPDSTVGQLLAHPLVTVTPHLGGSTREAQARIAVDLCKDILAVLAGRPPSAAVNAPVAADAQARPFVDLAYTLGKIFAQIADQMEPRFSLFLEGELQGHEQAPFTAAFLVGLLQSITDRRVSSVNAEQIGSELGISIEAYATPCERGFARALSIRGGSAAIAGTVVHGEQLRLIELGGYEIDFAPYGHILMTRHSDIPGVVGHVGTILGSSGINISTMHVARKTGGEAMMLMALDRAPSQEILVRLRAGDQLRSVRAIEL